jgi:hypothetical protein
MQFPKPITYDRFAGSRAGAGTLAHDPEKWTPVSRLREASFGLMLRRAKAGRKRSCAKKKLERDDDSKKSHHALARRHLDSFKAAAIVRWSPPRDPTKRGAERARSAESDIERDLGN